MPNPEDNILGLIVQPPVPEDEPEYVVQVSANLGFVTNSSSMVYHFPAEVMNHPRVQKVLAAFDVGGGFVGKDLWSRSNCGSLLITPEQKTEAREMLGGEAFYGSAPAINDEGIAVVYGDEYTSLASILCDMFEAVCKEMGLDFTSTDFNLAHDLFQPAMTQRR